MLRVDHQQADFVKDGPVASRLLTLHGSRPQFREIQMFKRVKREWLVGVKAGGGIIFSQVLAILASIGCTVGTAVATNFDLTSTQWFAIGVFYFILIAPICCCRALAKDGILAGCDAILSQFPDAESSIRKSFGEKNVADITEGDKAKARARMPLPISNLENAALVERVYDLKRSESSTTR
jgi:hypothetical protein